MVDNIFQKFAPKGDGTNVNIFSQFGSAQTQPTASTEPQWKTGVPDPFVDVAPAAINFLTSPARAVASDIYGVTPFIEGKGLTREEYEKRRGKAFEATALPESETGKTISKVLNFPGEVVGKVVGTGAELASDVLFGPERTKQMAPFAEAAVDVGSLFAPAIGPKLRPGVEGLSPEAAAAAKLENRARGKISSSFEKGLHEGGIGAVDVFNDMQKAREQGQPFTLADVQNPELRALIGTVYRQGGEARSIVQDFMKGRNIEQGGRIREQLKQYISDESARETTEELLKRRSENAKPLFDQAAAGGSLAPLEQQFAAGWNEVSRREADALQRVREANQQQILSAAKGSQAGDVYTSAAADRSTRQSREMLDQANADLQAIRQEKAAIHEKLLRAQADRTANAPGAVWSPRLQELMSSPNIKSGIARGYGIERDNALGRNEPFRPNEYAVIGEDAEGNPIVGEVPNMRLLMVAKEGLDAMVADNVNPETGRPTKKGLSLINLRDGLVSELDRLNPLYKQARDQWSGDTASLQAINKGKNLLNTKWFPEQRDVDSYLSQLSSSDREFVKAGLASDLLERIGKAPDVADKAKRVINSDIARERITALLGDQAGPFLDAIERERVMRETPTQLYGGSATAQRAADDRRILSRAAHGIANYVAGHHIPGLGYITEAVTRKLFQPNEKLNAAIAKVMTDPNVTISPEFGKPLLPSEAVTRGRRGMTPIEGALLGAGLSQATTQ